MKPKIGKGSASPPQSAHDKATSLRLLRGRFFRPKGRGLKPARKIDNRNRYCKITLPAQPCSTYPATIQKIRHEALSRLAPYLPDRLAASLLTTPY
jgi:hypothetical protein